MSQKRVLSVWKETILLVVTALVIALVFKTFFVQAFYIPSGSMEPTMLKDDKLLVQKISYWAGDIDRGDIVVFKDPGGWLSGEAAEGSSNIIHRALRTIGLAPAGGHLIKRVIGVGGDRVVCCEAEGKLTVNGTAVDEPYLLDEAATKDKPFDIRVPTGHLWVMGDNRNHSYDSRGHMKQPGGGYLAEDQVVGKAWLRVWPWKRVGFVRTSTQLSSLP